ncbi:iron-sulfur cluster carrier protein ApbC [Amorphus orientalis]|uniref:Iron-sulfur cluster carrier protein n=1 Tax=Amorphus orientalis TaxID=649198 RepID=A0AAE3VQC7_9HYPH|nr:iron-sulfur cluster carrier protein ApbC [Amorphus orientalis]MDQ0315816.1 ATP-binding protein involved in chromosome partitioning [Amorphus orientalis]
MATPTKETVRERLSHVPGPDGTGDLVSLGLVSEIYVSEGRVAFSISVPAERAQSLEPLRKRAEDEIAAIPGVQRVMVALTAERAPGQAPAASSAPPPRPAQSKAGGGAGPQQARGGAIQGIRSIIAVASGKGGVGKSTTAANLAFALARNGLSVGILDADIYGPSMPRLLGLTAKPEAIDEKRIKPLEAHGVKVMSIGFLVDPEAPMIWRGPMVVSALTQMLRDVAWGDLDVLVVDMPPGTGDTQLTLAQNVPLAGAVIVSTPQDLALIDARKGLAMFEKVDVPILGIVENMSHFVCPHCGERSDVFGTGGARHEAERLGARFLGEIPLHMAIRERSDSGTPIVVAEPDSPQARAFMDVATGVLEGLDEAAAASRPMPKIVIEDEA